MKINDYTMFQISKPWGYYPPDVEKMIKQYEETIEKLNNKLAQKIHQLANANQRNEKLEEELRALHLELSSLELPDTDEVVEGLVLNDFKNYPNDLESSLQPFRNSDNSSNDSKNETFVFDQEEIDDSMIKQVYNEDEEEISSLKLKSNNTKLNLGKKKNNNDEDFQIVT